MNLVAHGIAPVKIPPTDRFWLDDRRSPEVNFGRFAAV